MAMFHYESEGGLEAHQVDRVCGNADEEQLHDEEVERLPTQKQVEIAGEEYHQVDLLGFI